MHGITFQKVKSYLENLETRKITAGSYMNSSLKEKDISQLTTGEFIELLVRTKQPQIFAESAVYGDGTDWNQSELSILGDISIAVPVTVYDNGMHDHPEVHAVPFSATLLYVPGALLRNGRGNITADWEEVTITDQIESKAFYLMY